jgi:PiT family inorganic phosphate transporter
MLQHKLKQPPGLIGIITFISVLLIGVVYVGYQIFSDLDSVVIGNIWPYILLAMALFIALGFEFVNGFHDTAVAVATVIYTHSLEPRLAVVWSGVWNFIGVLTSSGAVAFSIVSLLPVELIQRSGSGIGFAMVFALLVAAIVWNLATWWLGLPSSSSHTLIGSIIGVGLANQVIDKHSGTSGVDWEQAIRIFKALLISPVVGFTVAALLLLLCKLLIKDKRLYEAPVGDAPPPLWIRGLLILTCTGVSYAHGSNDGQKGMGLIMLILIGTVPTAYALNHAVSARDVQNFVVVSQQAAQVIYAHEDKTVVVTDARADLTDYIRTRQYSSRTMPALRGVILATSQQAVTYKEIKNIPAKEQSIVRNDMYLIGEALHLLQKNNHVSFTRADDAVLASYKKSVDKSTKFIPTWVKVAVAMALGLGTMIGWKRIVITVGEKIGKEKMTYAQGASAQLVAMGTIFAADTFGLPVSTTHVLSSGVAGTMTANNGGLQFCTIRNIAMAWVLTLPASALLSAVLFLLFRQFV